LSGNLPVDDPLLITVRNGARIVGAAIQTPRHPLLCSGLSEESIDAAVAQLARLRPDLTGVRGIRSTATRFADEWQATTGDAWTVATEEHRYRLGPAAGVSRIGPVYTPQAQRGRGYGWSVTAAAAQWAHHAGATDVVLFTDLANPVSNAIYRRIGFEPVADFLRVDFTARR
jgi:RimJ/RimL family protein N-acetyltransferase